MLAQSQDGGGGLAGRGLAQVAVGQCGLQSANTATPSAGVLSAGLVAEQMMRSSPARAANIPRSPREPKRASARR